MGKKIYIVLPVLLAFAAGCDNDNESNGDALVLEASAEEIFLDKNLASEPAVTFTWNEGLDRGADYTVTYYFRLTLSGSGYDENIYGPVEIFAGEERSITITHQELHEFVSRELNIAFGMRVSIEARLVAKVDGPKFIYPEISYATIEVTNYAAEPLFMMGDATLAGSDPSKATQLTETVAGVYYWDGILREGGFKFIYSLGEELPSLNRGEDDGTLVGRTMESEPDNMFEISFDGYYFVEVNTNEMTIEYDFLYKTIFLMGDATTAGWDIDEGIELKSEPGSPNEFVVITELSEGELTFYTARDLDSTCFVPEIYDASITEDENIIPAIGVEDRKWYVEDEEAGTYLITLNTFTLRVNFEKL